MFGDNGDEIGSPILMEFDAIRPIKHPYSRSQTLVFDYFFWKTKKNQVNGQSVARPV